MLVGIILLGSRHARNVPFCLTRVVPCLLYVANHKPSNCVGYCWVGNLYLPDFESVMTLLLTVARATPHVLFFFVK